MKLRYPEDGYTRPAIIFFRAIGRLALRPRLSPPFRLLHHLPASSLFLFFHLSSVPLPSPKGKSMSMLCHFFHPLVPRSLSLSLARADRRHFFQLIFSSPSPFRKDYDGKPTKDATRILAGGTRFSNWRSRIVGISCARMPSEIAFFREQTAGNARAEYVKGRSGFFFFNCLAYAASELERSTLLLGNSFLSVAEISSGIHPQLILDEL